MRNKELTRLALIAALWPLAACSSDDDGGTVVPPPTGDLFDGFDTDGDLDVDMDDGTLDLPQLLELTPLAPVNPDASITEWSVTPALPAGLSIDTATGEVSGAPTAVLAAATYTVIATADDGVNPVVTDNFALEIGVRQPVVGLSTTRPLVRSTDVAGVASPVDDTTGGAPGNVPPVAGLAAANAVDTPEPAIAELVDLEDVPGFTNQVTPGVFDATQDFQASIAVFDSELSMDPWIFDALAPYDVAQTAGNLVPARPAFQFDTALVPIEDGELGLEVSLDAPVVVAPFATPTLPTIAYEVVEVSSPLRGGAPSGPWVEAGDVFHGVIDDFGNTKLYGFDPAIDEVNEALDINGAGNDDPELLAVFNEVAYLNVINADGEIDLASYDPATGTSVLLTDTNVTGDDAAAELVEFDSDIYFTASNGTGRFIYRFDTTTDAVDLISATSGVAADDAPAELTAADGFLWFTAADAAGVRALYRYSSTTDDQERLTEAGNASPQELTLLDGTLYMTAENGMAVRKLFRWDETDARIEQITDFQEDAALEDGIANLTAFQGDLFFSALRPVTFSQKLHRYQPNALPLRAEQLTNTADVSNSDSISDIVTVGDEVVFTADNPDGARQIWSFDNANGEVRQLIEVDADTTVSSNPRFLTPFGVGKLAVNLDLGGGVTKLFVYDSATRVMVQGADIAGAGNDDAAEPRATISDAVLFTANDGAGGVRLYTIE